MTVCVRKNRPFKLKISDSELQFSFISENVPRQRDWDDMIEYLAGHRVLCRPDEMHPGDIGELTDDQKWRSGLAADLTIK